MSSAEFRKIIDTLSQINETKVGRAVTGSRGQWVTGQHISKDPIPFTDKVRSDTSVSDDDDWMKQAAFGDGYKDLPQLYLDPENKRFLFVGGWSDKQGAYVYFPDNTAKTLGKVMSDGIRKLLTAKGMIEGEDFIIDHQHDLVKIFKKTK